MATSDSSVRTRELWNDGPAVEATLAHMHQQMQMQQQMQAQMQQQMQQMQQIQNLLQLQVQQPQPQVWPPLHAQRSFPPFAAFNSASSQTPVPQRPVRPWNAQEPVQPPPPGALWKAITGKKEREALELLKLPQVPGLNDIDLKLGFSMLQWAIAANLQEVALELLRRPEFLQVNKKDYCGLTCLHQAAFGGQLQVCKAILARADFSEAQARSPSVCQVYTTGRWYNVTVGSTALDCAHKAGHQSIVEMLQLHSRGCLVC
ncbi:unnamed protein product [Polarella glacialis]|uniref:Uncharacterized protein n=1 Tax=Polarella glacialis TaxID=89957 RepID=A0A813DJ38_POLGL|nr:unnamed protein product [Polarella glacialis]